MALVRFGEGATVGVRGNRHLRAACRESGLVVVNKNNTATVAWSFARNTIVMRRLPRGRNGRLYRVRLVRASTCLEFERLRRSGRM